MISAFGIEHGEISKAGFGGISRLGAGIAGRTTKVGSNLMRSGATNRAAGRMYAKNPATQGFGRGMQAGGKARMQTGGVLRRAGGAMAARPGLTGGAALGAGGLGAGAGVGMMNNRRRY